MAEAKQERFPDYPIFKGLQRPLGRTGDRSLSFNNT